MHDSGNLLDSSLEVLERMSVGLKLSSDLPVGGRLKHFWPVWKQMGASRRVVRWLRLGFPLRFKQEIYRDKQFPPLTAQPPPTLVANYADPSKASAMDEMLQTLLDKKCVRLMEPGEEGFFSRAFLVPKKSGGFRLVIDLSQLNTYLADVTFKMDTLKVVKEALQPEMWVTSLDLSDAYHHIPLREQDQKYVCFQVKEKRFISMVLPFGLKTAPWAFTEVVKQVKKWARRVQLLLFQYLDDWLNANNNRKECQRLTNLLLRLCVALGLLVNLAKSELIPVQRITFLGEILDLQAARAFTSQERKDAIVEIIKKAEKHQGLLFPQAERLLGLLVSAFPTVPLGRTHLRELQRAVIVAIRAGRSPTSWISVRGQMLHQLRWWRSDEHLSLGRPFKIGEPDILVFTDASTAGWGIVCGSDTWKGVWQRQNHHINWLELRTVLLALQLLQFRLRRKTVCVMIDNTTAVAYIKKEGGVRSKSLTKLARKIALLAFENEITLVPRHIAGQCNVLADLASRVNQIVPSEWTVSDALLQRIISLSPWGKPAIDLFANQWNHRLPRYVSPCPDPSAIAQDALSWHWPEEVMYAYPPTCLMTKVLRKLALSPKVKCLLIAPKAENAAWFPTLLALHKVQVTRLQMDCGDLIQPHWEMSHPDPMTLNLHLWCIQGRDCKS